VLTIDGFGLVNGFIDHLYTPIENTNNYSAIAISTINKSPQHSLSLFPACLVFISNSLAKASNSEESSASGAQVLSSQTPVQNSLSTHCRLNYSAISSQPHLQNSLSTHCRLNYSAISSQPHLQNSLSTHCRLNYSAISSQPHLQNSLSTHCRLNYSAISSQPHLQNSALN
jgi:hypothetical protein